MADLQVDLGALEAAATELGMLIHEFDKAEDIASDAASDIGSPTVAGAVHEFSSNWNVHKKELLDSMQAVHKMVSGSHDTFVHADQKLAEDIAHAYQQKNSTMGGGSGTVQAR